MGTSDYVILIILAIAAAVVLAEASFQAWRTRDWVAFVWVLFGGAAAVLGLWAVLDRARAGSPGLAAVGAIICVFGIATMIQPRVENV
jgi:hypothetical protein